MLEIRYYYLHWCDQELCFVLLPFFRAPMVGLMDQNGKPIFNVYDGSLAV